MTESARIASLETQVRTLKRMLFGVFGLVVAGAVLGATSLQTVPDVIQAKKFEVVNGTGTTVVSLDSFEGSGIINSFDKQGNMVYLVCCVSGPHGASGCVNTSNSKGENLVILGANDQGDGAITTWNGKGGRLVEIGATVDRKGVVTTQNGEGAILVNLTSNSIGGLIQAKSGKGGNLVTLGATRSGGAVVTNNDKGMALVQISAKNDGGRVLVSNGKGENLVAIGQIDGDGVVLTKNGKGEITSVTPEP